MDINDVVKDLKKVREDKLRYFGLYCQYKTFYESACSFEDYLSGLLENNCEEDSGLND